MRNSNLVLCGALLAGSVLAVSGASAADMAVKARPMVVDPAYNWTGFYLGVNGGYGWGANSSVNFVGNDPVASNLLTGTGAPANAGATAVVPPNFRPAGGLGGAQIGYNWQFNRTWVAGIEADFDGANINGSGTTGFNAPLIIGGTPSTVNALSKMDWFGTVRGRIGFLPTDRLLIFGTGGLAYGQVRDSVNIGVSGLTGAGNGGLGPNGFSFLCGAGGPLGNSPQANCFVGSNTRTAVGWTAGGGFEYAFWHNVSVKFDYLYVDLGNSSANVVASGVFPLGLGGQNPASFTARIADHYNIVRAGLNWKL
jgi:outer membrane immunogenic protein